MAREIRCKLPVTGLVDKGLTASKFRMPEFCIKLDALLLYVEEEWHDPACRVNRFPKEPHGTEPALISHFIQKTQLRSNSVCTTDVAAAKASVFSCPSKPP